MNEIRTGKVIPACTFCKDPKEVTCSSDEAYAFLSVPVCKAFQKR